MAEIVSMKVVRWRSGVKHISPDGRTTVCGHAVVPGRARVVADTTDWPGLVTCYNCGYRNTPPGYLPPKSSADFPLKRACPEHPGWPQGQCVHCSPARVRPTAPWPCPNGCTDPEDHAPRLRYRRCTVFPPRHDLNGHQRCPGQGEGGCESRERVLRAANPRLDLDLPDSAIGTCYHCGLNVCPRCQTEPVEGPRMLCAGCGKEGWREFDEARASEAQWRASQALPPRIPRPALSNDWSGWPDIVPGADNEPPGSAGDAVDRASEKAAGEAESSDDLVEEPVQELVEDAWLVGGWLDERWLDELGLGWRVLVPGVARRAPSPQAPRSHAVPDQGTDPRLTAVTALTRAVRECARRRTGSEQRDAAALIAEVVTAVVANLGSLDAVPHRAGSGPMDRVRDMVQTTTADGDLLGRRTETLHVYIDPAESFGYFGLDRMHSAELDAADEVWASAYRAAQRAAGQDPDRPWLHTVDIIDTPGMLRAAEIAGQIEQMYYDDQYQYVDAYASTIADLVAQRGITARVMVHQGDVEEMTGGYNTSHDGTADLHRLARQRTPLPQLGQAPGDIERPIADAVRAAGRTYTDRVLARLRTT